MVAEATCAVSDRAAILIEAPAALLLTVAFMLFNQRANLDHQVFDAELAEAHVEVEAALQLAGDSRAMNAPCYITFAESAHSAIIVVRIERLSLHFNGHLTEHLIELVVGTDVVLAIFNELECQKSV